MDWPKLMTDLAAAGYTQMKLAALCGVSQSSISAIARGETVDPSHSIGEKLKAIHARASKRKQAA